ncbi:MAG: hypothetical protein GY941_12835 [Planctomycetes bacterium]|nr:hypothetical protein [Planctomycetota bacterium]
MNKKNDSQRADDNIIIRCRTSDKVKWQAKAKAKGTTLSKVIIKRLKRL